MPIVCMQSLTLSSPAHSATATPPRTPAVFHPAPAAASSSLMSPLRENAPGKPRVEHSVKHSVRAMRDFAAHMPAKVKECASRCLHNLGQCYVKLRHTEAALQAAEMALVFDPAYAKVIPYSFLLSLSSCFFSDECIQAMCLLSKALSLSGRKDEALRAALLSIKCGDTNELNVCPELYPLLISGVATPADHASLFRIVVSRALQNDAFELTEEGSLHGRGLRVRRTADRVPAGTVVLVDQPLLLGFFVNYIPMLSKLAVLREQKHLNSVGGSLVFQLYPAGSSPDGSDVGRELLRHSTLAVTAQHILPKLRRDLFADLLQLSGWLGRTALNPVDGSSMTVEDADILAILLCCLKLNTMQVDVSDTLATSTLSQGLNEVPRLQCLSVPAAMLNHSCKPNCTVYLADADGRQVAPADVFCSESESGETSEKLRLWVRTTRDVEPGEELCICYVPLLDSVSRRREKLVTSWNISCTCSRCRRGVCELGCVSFP